MTDIHALALERLGKGDQLRMQRTPSGRVWWFEAPRLQVPDHIATAVIAAADAPVSEAGDSLFGLPFNSQTWISTTAQATPKRQSR